MPHIYEHIYEQLRTAQIIAGHGQVRGSRVREKGGGWEGLGILQILHKCVCEDVYARRYEWVYVYI